MNYYQVLDVSPDATPEDIKRAYRQLVRKHHPDVAGDGTGDRFHQIQAAYETLSDPGERRKYDLSVGWGRTPRTAIPYRPARSQSGVSTQAASQKPVPPKPSPAHRSSTRSSDASSRNGFNSNGRPQKRDDQTGSRQATSNRHHTSGKSERRPFDGNRNYAGDRVGTERDNRVERSSTPSKDSASKDSASKDSVSKDSVSKDSVSGRSSSRRESTANFGPQNTSDYNSVNGAANQQKRSPSARANGASSTGTRNVQSSAQSASSGSASYKPFTPPPRPEPQIPSFNKGVRSLKEALRSNRYSVATEIADLLVAHYPNRPLAMRLFVKAYHLRGNEMLYYKRYELAEIYLYEALKTAHSHYPELVSTIQSDLERSDTNRRELGMI